MKSLHIIGFFLLITITAFGQRPTETDIQIQEIYIEANKEKLMGNHEEAISLFLEVLKKDELNDAAAYELSKLYNLKGEKKKAMTYAKKAAKIKPSNIWYNSTYAELLEENEEYIAAAEIYEKLSVKEPNNEDYYYKQGYLLTRAQEITEAIKVYDKLEDKMGVNGKTSRRKYSLYLADGKRKKAELELKKLTTTFPKEIRYLHWLAEFYDMDDEKQKTEEVYKAILKLNPNDAIANLTLAESFKKEGEDVKFLTSLEELFRNQQIDVDVKVKELLPYIAKVSTSKDEALKSKVLDLAVILTEKHPQDAKSFSIYADLLYYSGNSEEALVQYEKTAELDNSVFSVWEQILYIHAELNNTEELLSISEDVMDIFPNQASVYYLNGVANSLKKNYPDAIDVFEQALMMSGKDMTLKYKIYAELATLYHNMKDYAKSDENFQAALKINPKDYYLLNNYSYYLTVRNERLEEAKEMSALSNELAPNRGVFQDTYGWVFYKMGDYKNAKKWLEKAIGNGGHDSPSILEHFGDVLYQLKDTEGAVKFWQKAVDSGGNSENLKKKLTDKRLYE